MVLQAIKVVDCFLTIMISCKFLIGRFSKFSNFFLVCYWTHSYKYRVHIISLLVILNSSFETANGIHAQETGYIKNKGDKDLETIVQQGKVTYHDEHGNPITLEYVADEDGFHPVGDHLPTPPPIPEKIQEALDNNKEEEEVAEIDERDKEAAAYVQYHPQSYGHSNMHIHY